MAGINSLLFLKVLCDLEKQKIETVPDKKFIQEAFASSEQLDGKPKSPCVVKLYMQKKHGVGGSLRSKRYACPRCSCLFKRRRHLKEHLQFHCTHKCLGCSECFASIHRSFKRVSGEDIEPLKTTSCPICPSSFQTPAGLAIHQEYHPESDKILKCESCSEQFVNRWELDKHQESHAISVVYNCKECAKEFSTRSNLAKHVRVKHKKRRDRYGDHFLAQLIKNPATGTEHSDEHKEEDAEELVEASSRVCSLCNKTFVSPQRNRTHVCSQFPLPESLTEEMFQQSGFQCPACSQIYSSLLALKMHCGVHTGADPLTCALCDKTFSGRRIMDHHIELHGKNSCSMCGVFFRSKLAYLLHHCGYTHRCFVCDEVFPTYSSYKKHLLVHPKPEHFVYKCMECKKCFLKLSYFRQHQINHTGKQPFACLLCDQKLLSFGTLREHALIHVTTRKRKCTVCDQLFKSPHELDAHLISHVKKAESCFSCENCAQSFESESALENHKSNCKVESIKNGPEMSGFECDDCGKVFRKQHQLFIHLRAAHGKAPSYFCYCDLCSRGFYHRLHLQSHRLTCSQRNAEERELALQKREQTNRNTFGKRQFQCSKCEKKFFTQQHLNNHMYVHREASEYPYQCALCGAAYILEGYFKKHLDKCKETDPKKAKHSFKCKECGATFISEKTLTQHTKAHGREWECTLCNEKFLTKRGYAKHKTICTPEKALYKAFRKASKPPKIYTCPTCNRAFQLKTRFEEHVASHQGILQYQCPTCLGKFMSINNFKRHKCKFEVKTEPVECEVDILPRDLSNHS